MDKQEVLERAEKMRGYNKYMASNGLMQHVVYQQHADRIIREFGFDPKGFKRIGPDIAPSPFLASLPTGTAVPKTDEI